MLELATAWRAAPADDELRRVFASSEFNDADWARVDVPGHWRAHPEFAESDGPLLYRTSFDVVRGEPGERRWLRFDGVFYQGDIWLDGAYVGDTEGYFGPHEFDVTDALHNGGTHLLAAEVACSPQSSRTAKRNLTGVFQHWDCIDPKWNPGGIWRPVRIERSGPVRIERARVLCLSASTERAELGVRIVVNTLDARRIRIRTTAGSTVHEQDHQLAVGSNRIEWRVTIERPRLWWPHALGTPELTPIRIGVLDPDMLIESDSHELRTGLRQVRMRNWIFEINGERLHLKGANIAPTRMAIGSSTTEELRNDLVLAKELGLDLLRVHAHVTHPDFYRHADELGMLIWQDMPLQWGYARSVRKQATRQARELIDLLGHHPSIVHWCGHNEPLALDVSPESMTGSAKRAAEMMTRYMIQQELPTWNKSVLDFAIHRTLTRSDPSRPVTAHSGVLPGPTSGGTDSHLYFGWYHGHERDLPKLFGRFPRMARFVSEFGAQAVPTNAEFCDPDAWPDLDWEHLGHRHGLQRTFFDRHVPPAAHATFAAWQEATQQYQAELLRRHIEEIRRIKYEPNGGFAFFLFADSLDHPAVTWSVLGHDRRPKLAYEAVQEACRPVIITADRPPEVVSVGQAFTLDVHVVSDLRHVLRSATVSAELHWPGGSHSWRWKGDVKADDVTRIGAVQLVAPSPAHPAARPHPGTRTPTDGDVFLDLTLEHPEVTATNRYRSRFV